MNLSDFLEKRNEPETVAEIDAFEKKYEVSIPMELKLVLLYSNGCEVYNIFVDMGKGNTSEYFVGFLSISSIEYAIDHVKTIESEYHYYFSDVLLPIGDSGGTRLLCVGIQGDFLNKVYMIDYQMYDGENYNSTLTFVANSIGDLLIRLKPDMEF
jgi:hypothetical protein